MDGTRTFPEKDLVVPFEWTKELTLHLIEEWKKYPCVWRIRTPFYGSNDDRMQAYKNILLSLKAFDSKCTLEAVKKKITALRAQYKKSLDAISKPGGEGTSNTCTPKLWCFKQLNFLNAGERRVRENTFFSSNAQLIQPSPSTIPVTSRSSLKQPKEEPTPKDDSAYFIGQLVEKELRKMESQQQHIARKLVSDVVFYGSIERLHPLSHLVLYPQVDPDYQYQKDLTSQGKRKSGLKYHDDPVVPVASSSSSSSSFSM